MLYLDGEGWRDIKMRSDVRITVNELVRWKASREYDDRIRLITGQGIFVGYCEPNLHFIAINKEFARGRAYRISKEIGIPLEYPVKINSIDMFRYYNTRAYLLEIDAFCGVLRSKLVVIGTKYLSRPSDNKRIVVNKDNAYRVKELILMSDELRGRKVRGELVKKNHAKHVDSTIEASLRKGTTYADVKNIMEKSS